MLWINLKAMLGFEASKTEAIENISDRHLTLEHYHFNVLRNAYKNNELTHPFIENLKLIDKDKTYGSFDKNYIDDVLTNESYGISDEIDTLIDETNLLKGFVDGKLTDKINKDALKKLDTLIANHMKGVGAHTRNFVRAGIPKT